MFAILIYEIKIEENIPFFLELTYYHFSFYFCTIIIRERTGDRWFVPDFYINPGKYEGLTQIGEIRSVNNYTKKSK